MRVAGPCFIVLAALLLSAAARAQDADSADKPYATIVARNMFGLLPIPPPDTNPPAPPEDPPPKITLNGIMSIFGRDQALYKVENKPTKPGQQAKEESYVLSEGERQDDITVEKIDRVNSVVTFDNHGTVQELPLVEASNGSGPAAGPSGGAGPGNAPSNFARPGGTADRIAMLRQRMAGRNGGSPSNPNFSPPANSAQPTMGIGSSSFQSAGTAGAPQSEQSIEEQALSAAQQMALIEEERIATQEKVDGGTMPPLPPTMLTPADATAAGGSPLVIDPGSSQPPPPATYNTSRPSSTPIY